VQKKELPHMKAFSLFIDKKTKTNFLEKPNNQKLKTKQNVNFPAPPILNIFFQKFHGLVLGLVGLIDVAQPIWP
jgi:hypothetical protein